MVRITLTVSETYERSAESGVLAKQKRKGTSNAESELSQILKWAQSASLAVLIERLQMDRRLKNQVHAGQPKSGTFRSPMLAETSRKKFLLYGADKGQEGTSPISLSSYSSIDSIYTIHASGTGHLGRCPKKWSKSFKVIAEPWKDYYSTQCYHSH